VAGDALVCLADSLNKNAIVREIVTKDLAQPQQRVDAVASLLALTIARILSLRGSRTSIALPRSSVPLT
jgi:hypothetical protein